MADPLGLRIGGRYRLVRRLARGRGAELYLAERKGRHYALKLLDPGVRAVAGSLRHRYVVPVYEVDQDPVTERGYVVMDLVEGYPLGDLLRRDGRTTPLPVPRALRLISQVLEALREAHGQGLVHAHLSPAKILVLGAGAPEEEVRILGFGLASEVGLTARAERRGFMEEVSRLRKRIARRDPRLQTSVRLRPLRQRRVIKSESTAKGAMLYAAPELLLERPYDQRADVYAAAAILYELICGQPPLVPPLGAEDPEAELKIVVEGRDPRPLLEVAAEAGVAIPRELSELVARALAKSPADRPQDARELRRELRRAQDRVPVSLAPSASPSSPPPLTIKAHEPSKKKLVIRPKDLDAPLGGTSSRAAFLLVAGGICLLLACLYWATLASQEPDPFAPPPMQRPASSVAWAASAAVTQLPEGVTWTDTKDVYQGLVEGSHLVLLKKDDELAFLSMFEVTWRQFHRYCRATKRTPPEGAPASDLAPVTSVTYQEAKDYCRWAGGRLPTPEEVRAAAPRRDYEQKPLREVTSAQRLLDGAGTFDLGENADEWLEGGRVMIRGALHPKPAPDHRHPRLGFRLVIPLRED